MPLPETKPRFRTTVQCERFDVFEVETRNPQGPPGAFEPRPRMAYSSEDAILALAEVLREQGHEPADFVQEFDSGLLQISQTSLLAVDGRHFRFHTKVLPVTGDVIAAKLTKFYPSAKRPEGATTMPEATNAEEETQRTEILHTGNQPAKTSLKKERVFSTKVRTVVSNEGAASEALQELAKQLTPELVAEGAIIVMGKGGPMIKRASAQDTDEDFNEEFGERDAEVVSTMPLTTNREVQEPALPPVKKTPVQRAAPVIKTISGDASEAMARTLPKTASPHTHDDSASSELDDELVGLGNIDPTTIRTTKKTDTAFEERDDAKVLDDLHSGEDVGGRRVATQRINSKGRGGTRPKR